MSKRLIMILALAFVVGIAFAAYAEVQNVKVSGDLTVLGLSRQLHVTSQPASNALASILRIRVDADLTDNVSTTVRLINERYWGKDTTDTTSLGAYGDAAAGKSGDNTNIDLDLAYATLKEFLYSPLTLTVGRQELHFGNDMIIGNSGTNNHAPKSSTFSSTIDADQTMRKSFDAIRATLNYDPLVVDIVGAQIRKSPRPAIAGQTSGLVKDDQETLVGINAAYTLSKKTLVEGYAWQKRIGNNVETDANNNNYTTVIGGRMITKPTDALTFQVEAAGQVSRGNNDNTIDDSDTMKQRRAMAAETALTYDWKKAKYTPSLTALYAYFSGNRGKDEYNKGWDPMYENQKFGDIANALFNQTNAHILGGVLTAKPLSDITLKGEYYAYWWDKTFNDGQTVYAVATAEALKMTSDKFAGQEVDLTATYDYTEDVQFSLLGGLLVPGSSFDKQNRNTAGEVIGKMKVTF